MIGDVLVSSILCETLTKAYPNAQIDYLIHKNTFPVIQENATNYRAIVFNDKQRRTKKDLLKFALKIRSERYDIIIDVYSKLESWIIVALSGTKKKISFKKKLTNFLYTDLITLHQTPKSNLGLVIEHRLKLLEPLNIPKQLYVTHPKINITEEENKQALEVLKTNKLSENSCMMINILGSRKSKTYPPKYMAQIIDCIAKYNFEILFNYIPDQIKQAKEIFNLCLPETQNKIHFEIVCSDIRSFLGLMNNCIGIVGNDGGAIHMAKAIEKPTFVVFSPCIDKKDWATFQDGVFNVSVHLKDFYPQWFEEKTTKELRKKTEDLYSEFLPKLFLKQIEVFCENHKPKQK